MKKFAFTLSEVLITLGIIGVVAAITMPTVINKINMMQYISKLKEDYSLISQAVLGIAADNEGFKNALSDCKLSSTTERNICLKSLFMSKLKNVADCDYNDRSQGKCFPRLSDIKLLNGESANSSYLEEICSAIVLPNGGSLLFYLDSADCTYNLNDYVRCGWITLDVNGLQKPNVFGKDIYLFYIFENAVKPVTYSMLAEKNLSAPCGENGSKGYDCADYYLYKK